MQATYHRSEYVVKESTLEDAVSIGARLRRSDIKEIDALTGRDPQLALKEAFLRSDLCWTAYKDDLPIAMFGAAGRSLMSTKGIPWMLGSPELDRAVIGIGKLSRYYVAKMNERYSHLENYIDARQTKSIRWLRWCDFNIERAIPIGRNGEMFHLFWRNNHV